MEKTLVKDIVLVLVVVAALVSFFYNPLGTDAIKSLQILAGGIIGWYTGVKEVPFGKFFKK